MDHRLLGWSAPEGPEGADEAEEHAVEAVSVPMIRPLKQPEVEAPPEIALPAFVDRGDMLRALNDALEIDPHRTAVITIDCQRSHLDLAVATMPVGPQSAASMVAATARLLKVARGCGMSVVHVLSQNRILPKGQPEALCNPFWAAVERSHHSLIPDRDGNVGRRVGRGGKHGHPAPVRRDADARRRRCCQV